MAIVAVVKVEDTPGKIASWLGEVISIGITDEVGWSVLTGRPRSIIDSGEHSSSSPSLSSPSSLVDVCDTCGRGGAA